MAAVIISFFGLAMMLQVSTGQSMFVGIIMALGASLLYSIYVIIIGKLTKEVDVDVTNAFVSVGSAFSITLVALITGSFSFNFEPAAWIYIIIQIFIANIMGIRLLFMALKNLGPTRTSVLSMSESLFVIIISWILLNESMTYLQIIGAALLILGNIAFLMFKSKKP